MSNLGFVQAMAREQIAVEQTKVGDRYVLEAMQAGGFTLGGEQSGHVVLLRARHHRRRRADRGCMLMSRLAETGASLAELAR